MCNIKVLKRKYIVANQNILCYATLFNEKILDYWPSPSHKGRKKTFSS